MIKALGFLVLVAALAGGLMFWLTLSPEPAPKLLAQVQGTSFDGGPSSAPVEPKPVEPPSAPPVVKEPVAPSPVIEPKPVAVEPKFVPPPTPEVKPAPPPEPKPVAVEPKPAPPPASAVVAEPKPAAQEVKPAPSSAPSPGGATEGKPVDDKPLSLTFAKLAFRYWPQTKDKGARDPFPKEIKALHGKKVILDGFMFPIDFEKGKVRSFLLSNGMFGCCFGDAPSITETIKVYRSDGKLMPYQSMARVTGILEVGEEFDADGYVDSVYRIKAEDVGATPANH